MAKTQGRQSLPVILDRLHSSYPNARYELNWSNPLELLVATILAAQCTDERVNEVTKSLFKKYPNAKAYAQADLADLEEDVRPTGYYKTKAEAIQETCQVLLDHHGGQVPKTMDEMLTLPRVARKTANVVLTNAYKIPSGIVVDSHVARVVQRLGLSEKPKPEKIEEELMQLVPQHEWITFGPALVLHGRYTCTASDPKCDQCIFEDICPKIGLDGDKPSARSAKASKSSPAPSSGKSAAKSTGGKPSSKPAASSSRKSTSASEAKRESLSSDFSEDFPQLDDVPKSWQNILAPEFQKPYMSPLRDFVAEERGNYTIFPPEEDVLNALKYTPYDQMKVLLLGQDPYHDVGQAHGLCFSVRPGIKPPPSLVNMFKELQKDLGCRIPNHGYLEEWAKQGILLLNAVLTVRAHTPNSHKDKGWEQFTDAIIRAANDRRDPVVFVLWGAYAQKKEKLIDGSRHSILKAAHPSPLSASKFFGSRPYSAVNDALKKLGKSGINWQLSDL